MYCYETLFKQFIRLVVVSVSAETIQSVLAAVSVTAEIVLGVAVEVSVMAVTKKAVPIDL